VGAAVDLATAQKAAQICCLNALAATAAIAGGLDKIERIVRVVVFVASDPSFVDQPKVANGASDLLVKIFGDAGKHVRSAVGAAVLPLDATVEVELVSQIR
jgi:enamine deaminase RidA (YjgF/YER057c/UK114 family)